jgi:hypothetical protein
MLSLGPTRACVTIREVAAMAAPRVPLGLGPRGTKLWRDLCKLQDFDPSQLAMLHEACRIADRLDKLDAVLSGGEFLRVEAEDSSDPESDYVLRIDGALGAASRDANIFKQLLTALRLPDVQSGKRPQVRAARGSYKATGTAGVSSLDRARAAKNS